MKEWLTVSSIFLYCRGFVALIIRGLRCACLSQAIALNRASEVLELPGVDRTHLEAREGRRAVAVGVGL